MSVKQWSFGDRLVHSLRPEWGVGIVTAAVPERHEGRTCQRLTVRFERAGLKTVSTALAELKPEAEVPMLGARPEFSKHDDPLTSALTRSGPSTNEVMLRLPDGVNDPFKTLDQRLAATFGMYRFSDQGASLLDWAAGQSGLRDPMTRFSRHELEDLFKRWCMVRDEHLKRLILEIKRASPALVPTILRQAPKPVQHVLRRLDVLR